MPKPTVQTATVKINGEKLPFMRVEYEGGERTILILDDHNNMGDEDDRDTLVNLCHKVCKVQREAINFVYCIVGRSGKKNIAKLLEHFNTDTVVLANDNLAPLFHGNDAPFFGRLKKSTFDVDTITTVPFYKMFNLMNPRKLRKKRQSLLGFVVRHLLAAYEGKNIFVLEDDEVPSQELDIRLIDTIKKFDKFMDKLEAAPEVAIDSEAENLARVTNKLFTWQWAFDEKTAYILPVEHRESPWSAKELQYIKKRIKKYIMTTTAIHIYHYAQFDIGQMMVWLDLPYYPPDVYDTIGGTFCTDESMKELKNTAGIVKPYSLETLEAMHGIVRSDTIVIDKEDRSNMSKFSLQEIADYGGADVCNLFPIKAKQIATSTHPLVGYKDEETFTKVVVKQLGVMSKVFATATNNGMTLDTEYVFKLVQPGNQFEVAIKQIYEDIAATKEGKKAEKIIMKNKGLAGVGLFGKKQGTLLDLGKPDHKQVLFFDVMGLEPIKIGANGKGSTDKGFQKAYKNEPIVEKYGDFNKLLKLKNAFADSVAKRVVSDPDFLFDGRLRSNYGYSGVDSGRGSSWDLNMQQIPSQGDLAKIIKKEFKVEHGRIMGAADQSAHEVRMGGVIAQDPMVRKTFLMANKAIIKYRLAAEDVLDKAAEVLAREGDIHIQNVKLFFNQTVDKKHVLRYQIKAIVFGTLYGKMAKGLAKELGIKEEEAQALIDVLFEKWSAVHTWIEHTHSVGMKTQLVHYPNGRIRHLWAYLSSDIWVQRAMDRVGVNAPIQGFASDVVMVAINEFNRWKFENCYRKGLNFDVKIINLVHDAKYWDSAFAHLPLTLYLTEHAMSTLAMDYFAETFDFPISIPLSYGVEFGRSWDKMEEWDMRTETLFDRIRQYGKDEGLEYDSVIKDAKKIYKVRMEELRTEPYKMSLKGNRLQSFLGDLNMFKEMEDA